MDRRLHVLYITSLQIVPAYSGGPVRTYNIAKELAKQYDLTLIVPQTETSIRSDTTWGPALASAKILGTDTVVPDRRSFFQKKADALFTRWRRFFWRRNPLGTVFMPYEPWYLLIDHVCKTDMPDVIILEQSWHIETLTRIRKQYPHIPCILSAQNVKTTVFKQLLASSPATSALHHYIDWCRRMESSLYRFVDALWTCSEHDLQVFSEMNVKHPLPSAVMANGVDTTYFAADLRPQKAKVPRIIYGGSLCWEPSAEAVRFFYQEVWPLILKKRPSLQWVILGRCPPQWMKDMVAGDSSIIFLGEVPDARPFFADASVCVCPLLSGSGTRLKILEAMSMGNPVVSTTIGAQGIDANNMRDLLIADTPEDITEAVLRLTTDTSLFHALQKNGRAFVEKNYEWSHLTERAFPLIEQVLQQKKNSTEPKK